MQNGAKLKKVKILKILLLRRCKGTNYLINLIAFDIRKLFLEQNTKTSQQKKSIDNVHHTTLILLLNLQVVSKNS